MSTRDPSLRLADLVIEYSNDWLLVTETMEPRRPGSIATLLICRGSGGRSPVERLAIHRADLLEVLGVVGRALKAARQNKTTRAILRLRYGDQQRTHEEIAAVLHFGERRARGHIGSLRRRVAGVLLNLGDRKLAVLWPFLGRSVTGFRLPE